MSSTVGRAVTWKYTAAQTGALPATWGGIAGATACSGVTNQSPINIVTSKLSVATTDEGNITGIAYDMKLTGTLINDGRSVTYQVNSPIKPYLKGGALTKAKSYVFDHMDFHFGSVSTQGSEHQIDAAKSPMELHLVHYDGALLTETAAAASTNADALAIVTFLFEVSSTFQHHRYHFHAFLLTD